MSTSPSAIFNGNSRYSSDFQAVIDRATAIATLPITALNNQKTDLTSQSKAVADLGTNFSSLQSAVDSIGMALGSSSFSAAVSDDKTVSVTLGDGAQVGSYSIEVIDAGAYATSLSKAAWVADTGPVHNYQLSLGGTTYRIQSADNQAASVAAAINTQYGDKVRATVVNVGTNDAPDNRISLQASTLGDLQPDLLDGTTSLQQQGITGAQAHYIVSNSGNDVYSSDRTVQIAQGVTLNLLASAPGTPTTITVTRSANALSNALSAFSDAFNAASSALDKQRGQADGVLSGQSIVREMQGVLSQISTYSASGGIGSLESLGLDLDKTGQMSFDPNALVGADLSSVSTFLGDSNSGFLKTANDTLSTIDDPTTGLIQTTTAAYADQSARLDQTIADQQSRVDDMKAQMQDKMAAADALIATMEQQYNYLSGMFSAMQTADQQYK